MPHRTSFLDKSFYEKFTDPSAGDKFVNITGVKSFWLLATQPGEEFWFALKDHDDPTVFANPLINTLIKFQWKYY